MEVYKKRSTKSAPDFLSISYLMGSPPTGTSIMTFTSSGGLVPIGIASRFNLVPLLKSVMVFVKNSRV